MGRLKDQLIMKLDEADLVQEINEIDEMDYYYLMEKDYASESEVLYPKQEEFDNNVEENKEEDEIPF